MRSGSTGCRLVVFVTLSLGPAASVAGAQELVEDGPVAADPRQSLVMSATMAQAFDDDIPLALRGVIDPGGVSLGGPSTLLGGTVDYNRQAGQVRIGATAASSVRYYFEFDDVREANHRVHLSIASPLARRTSLAANQSAVYSPSYIYSFLPQDASSFPGSVPASDYPSVVDDIESLTYVTAVTVAHRFSQRTTFSIGGDLDISSIAGGGEGVRDLRTYGATARLSRTVSRNGSVNAAYRHRSGEFGYGLPLAQMERATEHTLYIGFDHSRPLSATRRFTISGLFGSSFLDFPAAARDLFNPAAARQWGLSGEATIGLQVGRSWRLRGSYRRGFDYVPGLLEPVFGDSATAGAEGFLSRKLEASSSAGYSRGYSTLNRYDMLFDTYTANGKLRYVISPRVSAYLEYLYYFYDFQDGLVSALRTPSGFSRHGVRAGFTMTMPVLPR